MTQFITILLAVAFAVCAFHATSIVAVIIFAVIALIFFGLACQMD